MLFPTPPLGVLIAIIILMPFRYVIIKYARDKYTLHKYAVHKYTVNMCIIKN